MVILEFRLNGQSVIELVQEYGVARGTARKAIQLLRERGLVITVVGRGTYVAVAATNHGPTAAR